MVQPLNKYLVLILIVISAISFSAQEKELKYEQDYHKNDFKKFKKRAEMLASWQIQNLKFGALVVRFQNNQKKIDACRKIGDKAMEDKIIAETQFYIKLMMRAYTEEFNFCKVYFIYSQSSDSLLKGVKKGIFIDSTLTINNTIEMSENFYILAEKDYVYNSSIGFIKEDSAKYVVESGNRTIDVSVVLKNKFGHQLKSPFPYYVNRSFLNSSSKYDLNYKFTDADGKTKDIVLTLSKDITLAKQKIYIQELNDRLHRFYRSNQGQQITDPSIKPFLY